MVQMGLFSAQIWSISELTRYLRGLLARDDLLQDLWVQGEVSNVSRPSSGHLYFTLKDTACSLRCVMWKSAANRQMIPLREGDAVEVHGNVDIYEAGGQYQLYVDLIRPIGEGALYQEFLRLKDRLLAEGLFDPERKRGIPPWPRTIGVVTSPTGAALRDILNTLRRRYPIVRVVIAPTPVQGIEAPPGIVAALDLINRLTQPDVILLGRGGGSIEDLWAFNDERVARAIAASQAPVITGIGHETDFTIADFASDLRAPTPTASAELATPDRLDVLASLEELKQRADRACSSFLSNQRLRLQHITQRLGLVSPISRVLSDRQRLDERVYRMKLHLEHRLRLSRSQLSGLRNRLESLNPEAVLNRGYAIVSHLDGEVVRCTSQVEPGDQLAVRVTDGTFLVKAEPEHE
jgi:exodeoxyribonuclease VII large subunit